MADKIQPQGVSHRKVTEDDDVEGHRFARASEPEGVSSRRRAAEPEGVSHRKVTEEDDVEGHSLLDPFAARELARVREREVQQHAKRHEFERDARDAKKGRS